MWVIGLTEVMRLSPYQAIDPAVRSRTDAGPTTSRGDGVVSHGSCRISRAVFAAAVAALEWIAALRHTPRQPWFCTPIAAPLGHIRSANDGPLP
jgi:hypothetical protein